MIIHITTSYYTYIMATTNAKYDNCKIYSPNDKFLGFCDKKKYEWYIKKDLVDVIDEKTIKLRFEPKVNGHNGKFEEFCKLEITTQCVVCGSKEDLNKFHVVPLEFRKFFPINMKSHASHDIVLVCNDCQGDLNYVYHQYRTHLFEKFNITQNQQLNKIKTYANQMLKKMNQEPKPEEQPNPHQHHYKQPSINLLVTEYLGHEPSIDELEQLRNMCTHDNLGEAKSVGEFIVNKYKDDLLKFEEKWRKLFVESMDPEFLPSGW